MSGLHTIAFALSRIYHVDPQIPRICPFCEPHARAPYYVSLCPEHAGCA